MPALSELLGRTYRGYTGSAGPIGLQGIQGIQGVPGPLGYTGSVGASGIQGTQGIQGNIGLLGYTGSQGIQGIQGLDGAFAGQGIQGIQGVAGPAGATGAPGSILDLASQTNFILTYKSPNDGGYAVQDDRPTAVRHDNKGNIYVVGVSQIGSTSGSLNSSVFVSKIDPAGIVFWTKFYSVVNDINDLTQMSNDPTVDIDSNDNPFVMFPIVSPDGEYYTEIAKLNKDDGSIIWKRSLRDTTREVYSGNVVVDAENNVYAIVNALNEESRYGIAIFKYSNSGSLIWAKDFESSTSSADASFGYGTADLSNNLILWVSESMTRDPQYSNTIVKLDSNGNIIWQKNMQGTGTTNFDRDWSPMGVATDTQDNIYSLAWESESILVGFTFNYIHEVIITKLNSSGTLQWQKKINLPDMELTSFYPSSIYTDKQNNLYLLILSTPSSSTLQRLINVIKISSSGTILWSRKFYEFNDPYGTDQMATGGIMDSISAFNNKITFTYVSDYLSSNNYGSTYGIVAQLPYDGSSTGRYDNFYYLTQDASANDVSYPLTDGLIQVGNTTVDDSNGTIITVDFTEPFNNDIIVIDSGNVLQGTIVNAIASTNTLNWNSDTYDFYSITAQASSLIISPDSGNPITGKKVTFRIKDNGTGRSITWTTGVDKGFRAVGVTLPTTTVANKMTYVEALYDQIDGRWDVVNVLQEA